MMAQSLPHPPLFCAAVVASAHGLHGHVKVKCFLEDPRCLKTYSPFSNEAGEPVYTVKKILSQDGDMVLVSLEGVDDRTEAERLRKTKFMLSEERLPELSDETYYYKDLIGMSVISPENQPLGVVHAVHNFGAGELIELKILNERLLMIPFTHEMIPEVDLKKRLLRLSQDAKVFLEEEPVDV